MSRQRRRAIMRWLKKIAGRNERSQNATQMMRDTVELFALRDEATSLLLERLAKRPGLSPPEARLYQRLTGAGNR